MAARDVSIVSMRRGRVFPCAARNGGAARAFQEIRRQRSICSHKGSDGPPPTDETPLGMIGEPAALLQAAEGANLRLVASFSDIKLSGHLVARPGIKTPEDLRGRRLGSARNRSRTLDFNDPCA